MGLLMSRIKHNTLSTSGNLKFFVYVQALLYPLIVTINVNYGMIRIDYVIKQTCDLYPQKVYQQ